MSKISNIVYVLTNEAMPGFVKVGITNNLKTRMQSLYSTPVPLPFECYFAAKVSDANAVEKLLHDAFDDYRLVKNREFFQINPERVVSALKLAVIEEVKPDSAHVETQEEQRAIEDVKVKRGRFNFKLAQVPIGAVLTFSRDSQVSCKVLNSTKVEFESKEVSLTQAAAIILERMGYYWKSVQGPLYWEYDGETLVDRRIRLEDES